MKADPIIYCDEHDRRRLDLRPDGITCIPLLGSNRCTSVRIGPGLHYHPGCMEFCLCVRGNLVFETDGEPFPFHPGHVFVSSPAEAHGLRSNPKGLLVYNILFRIPAKSTRLLGLEARDANWLVHSLTHLPKRLFAALPAVRTAFERLFTLYDTTDRKSSARRVKIRAAALDLLIALVESARRLPPKPPEALEELADAIRRHPTADYPVKRLARKAGLSRSAFSEAFKRTTGLPLHAFVLDCRIAAAKRLLAQHETSITAVAGLLSFSSEQHFARVFRRIVGVSPREYAVPSSPDRARRLNRRKPPPAGGRPPAEPC